MRRLLHLTTLVLLITAGGLALITTGPSQQAGAAIPDTCPKQTDLGEVWDRKGSGFQTFMKRRHLEPFLHMMGALHAENYEEAAWAVCNMLAASNAPTNRQIFIREMSQDEFELWLQVRTLFERQRRMLQIYDRNPEPNLKHAINSTVIEIGAACDACHDAAVESRSLPSGLSSNDKIRHRR